MVTPLLRALPALLLLLVACSEPEPDGAVADGEPRVVAFTDARILDGTGASAIDDGVVVVRDGVISAVGTAGEVSVPAGADLVDLGGRWLVPGLVNAHGHVNVGGDRASVQEQLEIYAHYGVTTVVSLGEEGDEAIRYTHDRFDPALSHARIFASGPVIDPTSVEEARAEVARIHEMGADWVKFRVDDFLGEGVPMSPEVYQTVIAEARERSLPVAIHIVYLEDAKGVVEAGGSLVGHSVRDEPADQEFIDLLLERDVCLVPTLTRELSTFVYAERPDFFDDPFFLERSAPGHLDDYLTEEAREAAQGAEATFWREALPVAQENVGRLHDAGVAVAMGTDSGPPGRFQGYFEHVELEMMVDSGMSPEEALWSATGVAARCVGLEGIVGTIEVGAWGDLLALDQDPREDVRNAREIYGVWVGGNRVR